MAWVEARSVMATVMVVEDEEPILRVVREALEDVRHTVTAYTDSREALKDLCDPNIERPRVIVLDIMMPGLDGYTFHNILRANEQTRRIPLIVITCKNKLTEIFAQSMNVSAFLQKPFDLNDLRRKVAQALERGPSR